MRNDSPMSVIVKLFAILGMAVLAQGTYRYFYPKSDASSTTGEPNSAGGSLRPAPAATEGITHAGSSPPASKAVSAGNPPPGATAALFWAIRQKEGWDGTDDVGPAGERGPYQITRAYWIEGGGRPELYLRDSLKAPESERVMLGYWRRWVPGPLAAVRGGTATWRDYEMLARVHNGGPTGYTKRSTLQYWNDVRNLMTVHSKEKE